MFNYKKFSLPMIFTTFFSYSTNKTELLCANSSYSQCLNCFSYLLPAVYSFMRPLFHNKCYSYVASLFFPPAVHLFIFPSSPPFHPYFFFLSHISSHFLCWRHAVTANIWLPPHSLLQDTMVRNSQ